VQVEETDMPNVVCPAIRPWDGYNPVIFTGHKIRYDSNGGGAAGTYTASVVVPAYCYLWDVMLVGKTLWTGSSTIAVIVGDADDDNGFIVSTNLKSGGELAAGQSVSIAAGTALAGGRIGAYIASSAWVVGSGTYGRYAEVPRTITALVTAAGTATAGETHFIVAYAQASGSEPLGTPVFAAT
jgi:hypothetical protein